MPVPNCNCRVVFRRLEPSSLPAVPLLPSSPSRLLMRFTPQWPELWRKSTLYAYACRPCDKFVSPSASSDPDTVSSQTLGDEPELVNKEPESGGWMIKLSGVSGVPEGLMDKDAYAKFCEEEAH